MLITFSISVFWSIHLGLICVDVQKDMDGTVIPKNRRNWTFDKIVPLDLFETDIFQITTSTIILGSEKFSFRRRPLVSPLICILVLLPKYNKQINHCVLISKLVFMSKYCCSAFGWTLLQSRNIAIHQDFVYPHIISSHFSTVKGPASSIEYNLSQISIDFKIRNHLITSYWPVLQCFSLGIQVRLCYVQFPKIASLT